MNGWGKPPYRSSRPSLSAAVSKGTSEDTAVTVPLSCTDADVGDSLTYSYSQPAHGTLTGAGPNLTYTPAANYNGGDSFTYSATDSHGVTSTVATGTLTVSAVNDAPIAVNGSATTPEDTAASVDLTPLASDVETPDAAQDRASAKRPFLELFSGSSGKGTSGRGRASTSLPASDSSIPAQR